MSVFNGNPHPRDIVIQNDEQGRGARRRRNNPGVMLLTFAMGAAALMAFALALTLVGIHG